MCFMGSASRTVLLVRLFLYHFQTSLPPVRREQVVLNGVMLTARNRQVIGESPIRAVQELSLSSARLVRTSR